MTDLEERLTQALIDYIEWGAMTGSDRDLHHDKFLKLIKEAKPDYKLEEPEENT